MITIPCAVFHVEEFERLINSPHLRNKTGYIKSLQAFHKYFIQLENGFVVFHENYLRAIIQSINDIEKLYRKFEQISKELAGGD